MYYTLDPIQVTDVEVGNHLITLQLVDTSHQPFDPSIESTVNITVAEEIDWPTYVYPDVFSFVTTPLSGAFLGQVTVDGFQAEDDGVDIIAAFEPVSGICVGTGEFTSGGNIYGLNIYGDDSTTPEDDGMNSGENFLLVVYDASENRTITYTQEFDQWSNQNGAVIPAYSDWQAVYEFNCSEDNCWDGGVPPAVSITDPVDGSIIWSSDFLVSFDVEIFQFHLMVMHTY